jgi:hypothetical protein
MTDGGIAFCVSRRKKQQKLGSNGTIFSCQGSGQRVYWDDSTIGFRRLDRPHAAAAFIEPCLPCPADHPPSGSNWIHEIKHDGYRLMARRDPVGIRLITRRGNRRSVRDLNRPHLRSHRLRAIPRAIGHNHSEDHPLAPLFEKPVRLPPRGAGRRRLLRSPGAAEEGQRRGPRARALERAQALR